MMAVYANTVLAAYVVSRLDTVEIYPEYSTHDSQRQSSALAHGGDPRAEGRLCRARRSLANNHRTEGDENLCE